MVIGMFSYNSITLTPEQVPSTIVLGGIGIFSMIAALWFRGKFWNYAVVIGFELFLALFIAMAFPVMEMVLEAVLNEKLKKVGEKVRAHPKHMEKYYSSKK
jgi:TctA family transporter